MGYELAQVGIDPGQHGAIAAVNAGGEVLLLADLPHDAAGIIDARAVALLLSPLSPAAVCIEQPQAFVRNAHTTLLLGRDFGALHAAAQLCGWPLLTPTPRRWKCALRLSADKRESVDLARRLYGAQLPKRLRVDKCEALLLAHYAQQQPPPTAHQPAAGAGTANSGASCATSLVAHDSTAA